MKIERKIMSGTVVHLHNLQRPIVGCSFNMHEYVVLHEESHTPNESTIIKWCKQCGSVISNLEFNGVVFEQGDIHTPRLTQIIASA